MKVFFFVDAFPKLSETFVVQQIVGLIDRGYDVRIVADRAGSTDEVQPLIKKYDLLAKVEAPAAQGIAGKMAAALWFCVCHPTFAARYKFSSRYHLYTLLALPHLSKIDIAPDDVVVANFGTNGIKAAQLKRLGRRFKLATIFHGYDVSSFLRTEPKDVYSEVFRQSDIVLPVSAFWAKRLRELGCPAEKIDVFHMGIDLAQFAPRTALAAQKSGRPFVFVSTGRLTEKKGFAYSIEAFAKALPKLGAGAQYKIIGGGPLHDELAALCEKLGVAERVELLGAQQSTMVKQILADADVFIVPSVTAKNGDMEGIPVVLMEAQAMQIPVIATDHSGLKEGIVDGKTGLLVPERDASELAQAMITLYADAKKREQFGIAGRAFIEKEFNAATQDKLLTSIVASL